MEDNEFNLVKKMMIGLIIFNFVALLFAYFTSTNLTLGGVSNSTAIGSTGTLGSLEYDINNTSGTLGHSFDCLSNPNGGKCALQASSNTDIVSTFYNGFVTVVNAVFGFINLIISVITLFLLSLAIVAYIIVGVIPSLFTSSAFGTSFGGVFAVIYGFTIVIIVVYGLYVLRNIIGQLIGWVVGLIP